MSVFALLCVGFFIVSSCRGSPGEKLRITDQDSYVQKYRGDSLAIKCTGADTVHFVFSGQKYEPSTYKTIATNTLFRATTKCTDTGWYGCTDVFGRTSDVYNPFDDNTLSWTYVYVYADDCAFPKERRSSDNSVEDVESRPDGKLIIPCTPTSPSLDVRLFGKDGSQIETEGRYSYDPRYGFIISNATMRDAGQYSCSAQIGNETHQIKYNAVIIEKAMPRIVDDTAHQVVFGEDMRVNCIVEVDDEIFSHDTYWNVSEAVFLDTCIASRNASDRITTCTDFERTSQRTMKTIVELTVRNVTKRDEGYYECITDYSGDLWRAKEYIKVYDPDVKYINLTRRDNGRSYVLDEGQSVQWVVRIDAYPRPTVKWLDDQGKEIGGSSNEPGFAVNNTWPLTTLTIERLRVQFSGVYRLQASNDNSMKTVNFTLTVKGKPLTSIGNVKSYCPPNESVKMYCAVVGYPKPNVTWTFERYPNYPSSENTSILRLNNASTKYLNNAHSWSEVTATFDTSGRLNCTACNDRGCDSTMATILISDGNGEFGLIEPMRDIVKNDNFELTCAASIYNYNMIIGWFDRRGRIINATNGINITSERTKFTYRSTLQMSNVQRSHSSTYTCRAKGKNNAYKDTSYNLTVHDPVAPIFTETNLNKSETVVDLSTGGRNNMTLRCFVHGMPKPSVTWYKDDIEIKKSDQNAFRHFNQELYFIYLRPENDGIYTCRAENRIGTNETYQRLTIVGKSIPMMWIITVVVVFVILLILIVYFAIKMHREKILKKQLTEARLTYFTKGAIECLNSDSTIDDQAELLPYDEKWEFPQERLRLGKQLGSGAFGVVVKAEADGIHEEGVVTTVAVKMVRKTAEWSCVKALIRELKIMAHLGQHLNVVNLLGACTKNIAKCELMVIVEYCRFGNLQNYLQRHRVRFINQIDPESGKIDYSIDTDPFIKTVSMSGSNNSMMKYAVLSFSHSVSIDSAIADSGTELMNNRRDIDLHDVNLSPDGSVFGCDSAQSGLRSGSFAEDYRDQNSKFIGTQDLLVWAFQIARGMEYLSRRRVLHGDLAARNILLTDNNVVKICDFGLAKSMYKDSNYKKKGSEPLPIKWMAIESIRDRIFCTQSDVWSFGIVLWELFTLAETPYAVMDATQQYQKLLEGYRMEQPEYSTKEIYEIMLNCWKADPISRPSFTRLAEIIGNLLEEPVRMRFVDLNKPYVDMNAQFFKDGKTDYLTLVSARDHIALSSPILESEPPSPGSQTSEYMSMSPVQSPSESGIVDSTSFPESKRFVFSLSTEKGTSNDADSAELELMLSRADGSEPTHNGYGRRQSCRRVERDSGYCNIPGTSFPFNFEEKEFDGYRNIEDFGIPTGDTVESAASIDNYNARVNYVDASKQTHDSPKEQTLNFTNPSYGV